MEEIWKPIPGYEGYYEVSNMGNVRSVTRTIIDKNNRIIIRKGEIKKVSMNEDGYCIVYLSKNNICKPFRVHRLVALAFLPNPNNLPIVNHKDEDPTNNNVENLEWCTQKQNCNYGTHNKKLSQSQKGRKATNAVCINMCNSDTYEIIQTFNSIKEACEFLNEPCGTGNISKVINGQRKTAYGYYWEKILKNS